MLGVVHVLVDLTSTRFWDELEESEERVAIEDAVEDGMNDGEGVVHASSRLDGLRPELQLTSALHCGPLTHRGIGSSFFGLASLPRDGQPWPNMAILSVFAGYQDDGECVYAYVTLPFTSLELLRSLHRVALPLRTSCSRRQAHHGLIAISPVSRALSGSRGSEGSRGGCSLNGLCSERFCRCVPARPFDVCKDSRAVADYDLARV